MLNFLISSVPNNNDNLVYRPFSCTETCLFEDISCSYHFSALELNMAHVLVDLIVGIFWTAAFFFRFDVTIY